MRKNGFLLILAVNILCSCSIIESSANVKPFDIAEFNRNRELWANKNIQNYKMLIGAFGVIKNYSEQVRIEVRDGKMASTELLWDSGGGTVDAARPFDTVEKFFEFIAEQNRRTPKKLEIRYHSDLGYPISVEVDQDGQPKNGDEITVRIKKFEKVE